tara:strand:+ start:41 stop:385 length:345 start_codon:yes stop_codon:yes gene_type:complete
MEVQTESVSQLVLAFFGLTFDNAPQQRNSLFKQIHEIVFHGNGGYDWNTVYNMPIWLRRFTFIELKKYYDEEKKEYDKSFKNSSSKNVIDQEGKIKNPEFLKKPLTSRKPIKYK